MITFSVQADMDTNPSTPPGRGIAVSNTRPPDAPRKLKQTRTPIQVTNPNLQVLLLTEHPIISAEFLVAGAAVPQCSCEEAGL